MRQKLPFFHSNTETVILSLPVHTWPHLSPPVILPDSTCIHLSQPVSTCTQLSHPSYLTPSVSTCTHLTPSVSTCIHLSLPVHTCLTDLTGLHLYTLVSPGPTSLYLFPPVLPVSIRLTSTVQVNSEPSNRVTLTCIVLKLNGFLAGERVIRPLDDR